MKSTILTIFLCSFLISSYGQFSFLDHTDIYLDSTIHYDARLIAITDINNDGLDDISTLQKGPLFGGILNINSQNEPNTPFTSKSLGTVSSYTKFSICIADLNNNGENEAILGGW